MLPHRRKRLRRHCDGSIVLKTSDRPSSLRRREVWAKRYDGCRIEFRHPHYIAIDRLCGHVSIRIFGQILIALQKYEIEFVSLPLSCAQKKKRLHEGTVGPEMRFPAGLATGILGKCVETANAAPGASASDLVKCETPLVAGLRQSGSAYLPPGQASGEAGVHRAGFRARTEV